MTNQTTNVELNGADVFSDWEKLLTQDATSSPANEANSLSLDDLITDNQEEHWLHLFQKTNLSGMDLVALQAIPNYTHDFAAEQAQIKAQSHLFLMNLVTTYKNDLRIAGLSEDQITNLSKGVLPINWTVHLKYPVAYGGTITINNFVLMPHTPFHEDLHNFLNRQMITDAGVITPPTLYVPIPKSSVYIPFSSNEIPEKVLHFKTIGGNK